MIQKEKNIHWFPGHMKKALNEIEAKIKLVDIVIEVLDARIPASSLNYDLEKRLGNKPRIYLLNKLDLADEEDTKLWAKKYENDGRLVVMGALTSPMVLKYIKNAISSAAKTKRERDIKRGLKPQPVKVMIIGIPNGGKSTLINKLARRNAAATQNKPGLTRAEQWIKVDKDYILLDTPGILQTKYESPEKAAKLALIGSIRDNILPFYDLADTLYDTLFNLYGPLFLKSRFDIELNQDSKKEDVYKAIAIKRGLLKANEPDIEKAQILFLKEYRDGLLGKYNLEKYKC